MNSNSMCSSRMKLAVATVGPLIVCGCTVGPNYKRPDVVVQHAWTHPPTTQASVIDEASPPSDWWATLNDSQLNSLVRRACDGNLSVSIARTRIAEARAERGIAASRLFPSLNGGGAY